MEITQDWMDPPFEDLPECAGPAQRWLWSALVAAPLLAVFAGLTAVAALSRGVVMDKNGLVRLEYSRLDRFAAPTILRVQVDPSAVKRGAVRLLLSYGYVDAVRINTVYPAPTSVEPAADGVVFTFRAQGPKRPMTIVFQVEGVAYGALTGELGVAEGPRVTIKQYLLP